MQARYVILQVLLEEDGLVKVTEVTASDGQPDLLIQLDRQKIPTTGKAAIASFLQKLQVGNMLYSGSSKKMFLTQEQRYTHTHAHTPHLLSGNMAYYILM